ncbi:MAG: filamentous hemagglutinin N-terminal domain-containing protein, partial [Verrucomicrobiota bacterium]
MLLGAFLLAPASRGGDILRGGVSAAQSRENAYARGRAGAENADIAKTAARDRLARTTEAISAVRRMQQGAAASSVSVPDGLVPGGLDRAAGLNARWDGALDPVQNGNTVGIKQTKSQAILHWETFNVGGNTIVQFDQSGGKADAGKWIAFNKVFDPGGVPSQILGSIKAEGQVYILNQNGIIFGAGSQVNTRTLVASSLPINDNLVTNGLLNNRDAQFLFSALEVPGGSDGTPP